MAEELLTEEQAPPSSIRKIGLILGPLLFLGALLAPAPEGMSVEAKRTAGVVLLMAVWWITEAVEMAITSLLPLVLFPVLGILPSEKTAPYFTDHTIFLYFGGFVVALAIQKWNLHRRIALHTYPVIASPEWFFVCPESLCWYEPRPMQTHAPWWQRRTCVE